MSDMIEVYERIDGAIVATSLPKAVFEQLQDTSNVNYLPATDPDVAAFLVQRTRRAAEQQAAADKAQALADLVVTTKSGRAYDGHERARAALQHAITTSSTWGKLVGSKVAWKLADNSVADVPVSELSEALSLAVSKAGALVTDVN